MFAQFDVKSISTNYENYYLVFSPWSTWSGFPINDAGEKATIYAYEGDNILFSNDNTLWFNRDKGDLADYNYIGENYITAVVVSPANGSWYSPNNMGGYIGDSYVPIRNFIDIAVSETWDNITFKVDPLMGAAAVFRDPVILACNTYPTSINPTPIPAAVWLFGSGLVGLVGLKKKRAKK